MKCDWVTLPAICLHASKFIPYSNSLSEFGGEASLEKHGNVLVSGEDLYKGIINSPKPPPPVQNLPP